MASLESLTFLAKKSLQQLDAVDGGIRRFDSKLIIDENSAPEPATDCSVIEVAQDGPKDGADVSEAALFIDSIVDKVISDLNTEAVTTPSCVTNSAPLVVSTSGSDLSSSSSQQLESVSNGGNMFSDVFDSKGGELEGTALEDSSSVSGDDKDKICKICSFRLNMPRVLSCLHVFCEACLNNILGAEVSLSSSASDSSISCDSYSPPMKTSIECPTCKQLTTIGPNGVASLTCDYILTNVLDLSAIECEHLSCTSCTSKEKAISRCSDCANLLCGGCDNAHKYMRCFENHEVVRLEDLQKATTDKPLTIHKPLFCHVHAGENLKYYCFNCQIPVCNDCLITDHKGSEHHYDILASAEKSVRVDVENLMKEAKSKVQYCDAAASNLTTALTELQSQHDSARQLITETYQNFVKVLEQCRESALAELSKLHSERELKIMDLMQSIENTMGKIDSTCKFTVRVLDQGNAAEFLSMKKLISAQFIHLINSTPKCDINFSLTFDSKTEKFEQMAHETFGKFCTESTSLTPKESTPPPTLPGMPPSMMAQRNALNNSHYSQGHMTSSTSASTPLSQPTSMQSSFETDLSVLSNGFMLSSALSPESPPQPAMLPHHNQSHHHPQHQIQRQQLQQPPPSAHHQQPQQQQQQHLQHQHQHQHQPLQPLQPQHQPHQHSPQPVGINGGFGIVGGAPPSNNINTIMGGGGGGLSAAGSGIGNPPLTNGFGPHMGQNMNGPTLNGLNGVLNGGTVGNAITGGLSSNLGASVGGSSAGHPPAYNSMLEYNLSRLASLTETTPDTLGDALVGNGTNAHHQAVVAPPAPAQPITLADILVGDQRALNNLQALAKLGLNNNDLTSNQLSISSGPSSDIDCLLPDFCLPSATSPNLSTHPSMGSAADDMSITNFHVGAAPGGANIVIGRNKATPMQIRCKFGSLGTSKGQFNSPHGFCLGVDEEIIVADTNNHRIEVFDKTGTLKFQFGVPGKEEGQLWYPRKVAVMHNNGKFVVCDRGNERSRMQIFSKCGHFMRKIAIRYIDIVAGLAVTAKGHIVAVDSVSPTVFVISEDGELVRWFDCSDYMREPSDIAIRDNEFYVCDFKGHCVAVFQEDGTFQYRIGNEKVTCFPNGIDISNAGDILIGDSHGNRFHVACYSRDGVLHSEFECPHVKVSRCCGLKITSEGYVVTLAKNNHHVLVLNTLYVH